MIRSALDREAQHNDIDDPLKAIAFHCDITSEDIRILDVDDGADMKVLRHFVAVDKRSKSVILALRGTLSISGAFVDMQAMSGESLEPTHCDFLTQSKVDFCGCRAHKGMAEMANNIWEASGNKITELFRTNGLEDYSFTVVGHSLGAGTACLLNIKIFEEKLLVGRKVRCFAFAPPPTFSSMGNATPPRVQDALNSTIAYIHDADCVPFLSVRSVQRLVGLFKAVDERTKDIWALRRFMIFWEWEDIPEAVIEDVKVADRDSGTEKQTEALEIAAAFVVWMKKSFSSKFEAYGCDPRELAGINLQVSQDMLTDHLVEPYEDCLDELAEAH